MLTSNRCKKNTAVSAIKNNRFNQKQPETEIPLSGYFLCNPQKTAPPISETWKNYETRPSLPPSGGFPVRRPVPLAGYVFGLSANRPSARTQADRISSRVTAGADGDPTCLDTRNRQIKVRLHGIDAPEKSQAFGRQAERHLSDLVSGKTVMLDIADTDRYGRTVAEAVSGSLNINREMVRDGYAWAYRRYGGSAYAVDEAAAKSQRLGLWRDARPVRPSESRRGKQQIGLQI